MGLIEKNLDTFPKLLKLNAQKWSDKNVATRYKKFGIWNTYTWKEYYEHAKHFGLGLKTLGLDRGDKVCIVGDNAPEGYFAELGIQALGGIMVGFYSDATPDELKYLAGHSDIKYAVCEDQEQVDKFLQIKDDLHHLKKIIYWDPKGLSHYDDPILISFSKISELGKDYDQEYPGVFDKYIEEGSGGDICMILYTSGTRALPKGAILTYTNILSGLESVMKVDYWGEDGQIFSLVPLAWVPEQVFGIGGSLLTGASVSFAEEPETVRTDMREIGPTQLSFSSRQWESLTSEMMVKIEEAPILNKFIFNLLLSVGHRWVDSVSGEKKPGIFLRFLYKVADLLLFCHIRDDMGLSKLRFAWTSGASISPDSYKVLITLGIPLRSHYASTEVCAICNSGKELRAETVGKPIPGIEVRISDEGEILVRGPQVFGGYYKDQTTTKEVFKDGWFCTGDAGFIDEKGHLIFLDRLKDMAELKGGGKVSPQYIESRLRFSIYIKDALIIGDKDKDFLSGIIIVDYENVGRWAEKNRIPYTTFTDLSQKEEISSLILKEVKKITKSLPPASRIKKFVLFHKEFDPDEAEMTRSRKLRRDFIITRYGELVKGIYDGLNVIPVSAEVKYRDGKSGVVKTSIKVIDVE